MTTRPWARSRTRRVWLSALVIAAALATAPTLAVAAPPPPQLSITVDNGHTSTRTGEKLDYTITVTNLGGKAVKDLQVTETVPAGSKFVSADAKGQHKAGKVTWKVTVDASKKAVLRTTLAVNASTPPELLRLATVACAHLTAKAPPLVCAADSDQLPAGAAAEAAQGKADAEQAKARAGFLESTTDRVVAGSSALAVLLAVLAAVGLQRRRTDASPPLDQADGS
jgi:uncharacterized repeat protein (TIGR01451 family)